MRTLNIPAKHESHKIHVTDRSEGPIHLTRRGRLARTGAAVVAAAGISLGIAEAHSSNEPKHTYETTVTVQSPMTEWSLAQKAYPNSDPRDHLAEVQGEVDAAAGHHVQPGALPNGLEVHLRTSVPPQEQIAQDSNR